MLCSYVVLLIIKVGAEGISPHIKEELFDKLRSREHIIVRYLQSTTSNMSWFRRFIHCFSFIIKPLLDAMKSLSKMIPVPHLDEICIKAINKVERALLEKPVLAHPDPTSKKFICINAGCHAFATTLYQQDPLTSRRHVVEHWFRVWTL